MNNIQVRCFLEAAKTGSVSAAAESLFYSAQAVSKNISKLEDQLGVRLFERDRQGLRLTASGKTYQQVYSKLQCQLDALIEETANMQAHTFSRFRIGYSEWIDPLGQINAGLRAFRNTHTSVVITARQYTNRDLLTNLLNGELDVAIYSEGQLPHSTDLESAGIAREDIRLYVPGRSSSVESQSYQSLPVVMAQPWNYSYIEHRQVWDAEMERLGITPERYRLLPNLSSMFAELACSAVAALGDHRFGRIATMSGLTSIPLESVSDLKCVYRKQSEHPMRAELISCMRHVYDYPVQDECAHN